MKASSPNKNLCFLRKNWLELLIAVLVLTTILLQLFFIHHFSISNISEVSGDPRGYLDIIMRKLAENSFYPSKNDVYSNFMFAPGFINYGTLILKIFNNPKALLYLNAIFTLIIAFELYYIGKCLVDKRTGKIATIIFLLAGSTQGFTLLLLTQLPFAVMFLLTIILFMKQKWYWMILTGICMALANWIRPFGPVMILSLLSYAIINKYKKLDYVYFFLSFIISIAIIGSISKKNSGYFIYQSTTSGINLRMGAHPNSDGSYIRDPYFEPNISEDMTFLERDKQWKENAISWIKDNPLDYIMLAPKKLWDLFKLESYSLEGPKIALENLTLSEKTKNRLHRISYFFSITHYLVILILSLFSAYYMIINRKFNFIFLWLCVFLSIGISLIVVGSPLYRHHILLIFYIFSAYTISQLPRLNNLKLMKK